MLLEAASQPAPEHPVAKPDLLGNAAAVDGVQPVPPNHVAILTLLRSCLEKIVGPICVSDMLLLLHDMLLL
jgi:hypothetical protein